MPRTPEADEAETVSTTVRFPRDIRDELAAQAEKEDRSFNMVAVRAAREYLRNAKHPLPQVDAMFTEALRKVWESVKCTCDVGPKELHQRSCHRTTIALAISFLETALPIEERRTGVAFSPDKRGRDR